MRGGPDQGQSEARLIKANERQPKICALIPGNTISTLTPSCLWTKDLGLKEKQALQKFCELLSYRGYLKKHLLVVLGLFDVEVVGSLVGEREGPCVGSPDSIIIPHIILKVRG